MGARIGVGELGGGFDRGWRVDEGFLGGGLKGVCVFGEEWISEGRPEWSLRYVEAGGVG